ncbi:IS21 family transposase [Bacillus methanolicus]|uniref:IS21 family transposase n=1 Tax=Bacillus methanolicus TaxID=1471 RepID=UPI00237FF3E5|nr:IS21 family transposase [Bacillus methanolicus]MDE3837801.1 IS21 family transposase [Bacillus methanolicus]MDE3840669.1 IS21 family transposase [Bacillus methanolicus]MDE3840854.1 IS21 family transposase [Bacillus methanolicus]
MDKFEVYVEIRQLLELGFSKAKVAKKLGISRPTLYRYLNQNPKEMVEWIDSTNTRSKKLDPYKSQILTWLNEHPDMSAAQVEDWLKERYSSLEVSEGTVRSYVRELRIHYGITKETLPRSYEAVPEVEMGEQVQVDFGETHQYTRGKKKVKLYFIAFVLSHSRYKYMEWLDRPFTTRDVIRCHENAFQWFGGIPREIVYDQDSLILVSENGGDLILTKEFESYRQERKLKLRVCRKADPESKGKIENVVGYIKHNFAKHREFTNIDEWNEAGWEWLNRTGNYKIHNTTKKRPVEVFQKEKQYLRPVLNKLSNLNPYSSITRAVRKDNTIRYQSNRYSVPLGTYNKQKEVYITESDGYLFIYEKADGPLIAKHKIFPGKGQLIQDRQHTRDRTKGIDAYIETVSRYFTNSELAKSYLQEIRKKKPRYIRDQLQIILKQIRLIKQSVVDKALEECMNKKLYTATDFTDMAQYLQQQKQINSSSKDKEQVVIPVVERKNQINQINTQKRDVNKYISVLEGQK